MSTTAETSKKSVAPTARRGYNTSQPQDKQQAPGTQPDAWTCAAQVPDARGVTRVTCSTSNSNNTVLCAACGASRTATNRRTNMATPSKPSTDKNAKTDQKSNSDSKPKAAAAAAPTAAPSAATAQPTPAAAPAATAAAPKAERPAPDPTKPETYKGLPRLRFYSVTPGKTDYCVRILPIFLDKYGAPKDPDGVTMALRPKQARELGGDVVPAKVKRIEAKEAREKLLAGMTDEQKLAYVTKEREERRAAKATKEAEKKAALMAELRKELESQGLVVKA